MAEVKNIVDFKCNECKKNFKQLAHCLLCDKQYCIGCIGEHNRASECGKICHLCETKISKEQWLKCCKHCTILVCNKCCVKVAHCLYPLKEGKLVKSYHYVCKNCTNIQSCNCCNKKFCCGDKCIDCGKNVCDDCLHKCNVTYNTLHKVCNLCLNKHTGTCSDCAGTTCARCVKCNIKICPRCKYLCMCGCVGSFCELCIRKYHLKYNNDRTKVICHNKKCKNHKVRCEVCNIKVNEINKYDNTKKLVCHFCMIYKKKERDNIIAHARDICLCNKHINSPISELYHTMSSKNGYLESLLKCYCCTCETWMCLSCASKNKCKTCDYYACAIDRNDNKNNCTYCAGVIEELNKFMIPPLSDVIINYFKNEIKEEVLEQEIEEVTG